MALSLRLEQQQGQLVIRSRIVPVMRYVVGVPILLAGLALLAGLGSMLVTGVRTGGLEALLKTLAGSWLMGLFTLMLLPLGGWLTFGQRYVVIETPGPTVAEVTTWIIGRRVRRTPAAAFRAVRVAVEPLLAAPSDDDSGATTWCQQIRLLARDPERQASFDVASLDLDARADAVSAASQIAGALGLPLEIVAPEARVLSPERAAARNDDDPDAPN